MKFDHDFYTFQTRLLPFFLVILPLALTLLTARPTQSLGLDTVITLATSLGVTALFAQLGRDAGKRKESRLFQLWSGPPTSLLLSHQNSRLDRFTRARYQRKLESLIAGLTFPTPEGEKQDPNHAFGVYQTCVNYLREKTRDRKRFPLIYAENVNYGFRRNLWAMKPAGLFTAMLGVVGSATFSYKHFTATENVFIVGFVAVAINCALLAWWLLRINPNWVKLTAEAYAERLLAACDNL